MSSFTLEESLPAFIDTLEGLAFEALGDIARPHEVMAFLKKLYRAEKHRREGDLPKAVYVLLTEVLELPSFIKKARIDADPGLTPLLQYHLDKSKSEPRRERKPAEFAEFARFFNARYRPPEVTYEEALAETVQKFGWSPSTIERQLKIPNLLAEAMKLRQSILGE